MVDELAELRKRRLAELQERAQQEQSEEEQLQSQIAQLESIVKPKLSKEALNRYSNLRVVHAEIWLQSLVVLAQLLQGGKIKEINDEQYKAILQRLQPKKKDIKIRKV